MRRSATRRLTSVVVLGLGLAVSAGCAIDKGSALAEDFEDHWTGTEDVAQVDTTRDNTLPFAGSASGDLILEEGTSTDRAIELANELSEYVADHDDVTGRIIFDDSFSFAVASSEERTEEVIVLWQSLASDDRVLEGDIDLRGSGEDRWLIEVTLADSEALLSVYEELAAEGDAFRPFSWTEDSSLELSGGSFVVESGVDGVLPAEAFAAYEAVAAQFPIAGAYLATDRASIRVGEGTDLAQAESLAKAAAPGLDDRVEVVVDGT